jgi:hypothetical protein
MKHAEQTPAEYFARFFGHGNVPVCTGYTSGAVFAVCRPLIHSLPLDTYRELMKAMFLGPMEHFNPETGYYMERFWLAMWEPDEYVCWNEDDVASMERKVDGQLAKGRWLPLPGLCDTFEKSE